jgi:hypothetical protein
MDLVSLLIGRKMSLGVNRAAASADEPDLVRASFLSQRLHMYAEAVCRFGFFNLWLELCARKSE